ncbi:MAG: hypothetical protein DRI77_14195 [Chloroflexi bacterium]|nr:MAG: hypothetical protein DRI77_14195 [Chloroflexota bacterium]
MTQIVVSPARLEAVAHTFDGKKTETETMINTLRSTMDGLNAEWASAGIKSAQEVGQP